MTWMLNRMTYKGKGKKRLPKGAFINKTFPESIGKENTLSC